MEYSMTTKQFKEYNEEDRYLLKYLEICEKYINSEVFDAAWQNATDTMEESGVIIDDHDKSPDFRRVLVRNFEALET